MFNRLLTKLKSSKPLKFSFNDKPFTTANLAFRLNPKHFSKPIFDYAKLVRFVNGQIVTAQTLGPRLASNAYTNARIYGKNMRNAITRRTIMGSIVGSLAVYMAYEYNPWRTKILLSYDRNDFNEQLVSGLPSLHDTHFYPSLFGTTPITQAILNKTPPGVSVRYNREPLIMSDGGQITLDWALPIKEVDQVGTHLYGKYYPYQCPKDTKIVFIIHGLTGGSETNYIQTIVNAARKKGYRTVVMNQRGVNQPLVTPLPFHGGRLGDLEHALAHVKNLYPDAPIMAVGTSFGGNQLVRYLGEAGDKTNIIGGVMLCAPFDLDDCVDSIEDTIYEKFFIRSYFDKNVLPNMDIFTQLKESHDIHIEDILKVRKLRDFHTLLTVKLYEHKDVSEYFATTKVLDSHIQNVKVPLLVLNAKDDPIAVHRSVPIEKMAKNPNFVYAETAHGGHLCWYTGLKPRRWYKEPTVEFMERVLELKMKEKKESQITN